MRLSWFCPALIVVVACVRTSPGPNGAPPDAAVDDGRRAGDTAAGPPDANNPDVTIGGADVGVRADRDAGKAGRSFSAIAAGRFHACAVEAGSGGVTCWGRNDRGQLGDGSATDSWTPRAVPLDDVKEVDAGESHSCALQRDGDLWCWGHNSSGQLGDGSKVNRPRPVLLSGKYERLALARWSSCAVAVGGKLLCWGAGGVGQLGDGTNQQRPSPVEVASLAAVSEVACADEHCCSLAGEGPSGAGVYCWGRGGSGRLGDGTEASRGSPLAVALPVQSRVVKLALTTLTSCALHETGELSCWGSNDEGEMPGRPKGPMLTPGVISVEGLSFVAAGDRTFCGGGAGGLRCWGFNERGELGIGTPGPQPGPVMPTGLGGAQSMAALGYGFSCALSAAGEIRCWGANAFGQLGIGRADVVALGSSTVALEGELAEISLGAGFSCARTVAGAVYCWGLNSRGQLGGADEVMRATPHRVALARPAIALSVGEYLACAVLDDNKVSCWGGGWVGDGTQDGSKTPRAVDLGMVTDDVIVAVACSRNGACVRGAGGRVACWGWGGYGQAGDGSGKTWHTPRDVSTIDDATQIAAAKNGYCAIRGGDGSTWCWGYNGGGELGDGTRTHAKAPVQAQVGEAVNLIDGGEGHFCARSAARVWCWGNNVQYQLGTSDHLATGPFSHDLTVKSLSAGSEHSCAVLSAGGKLYCWGDNTYLQAGMLFSRDRHSPPAAVSSSQGTWLAVAAGDRHSCGISGDGSLSCWGSNAFGQLGNGSLDGVLEPTAVP